MGSLYEKNSGPMIGSPLMARRVPLKARLGGGPVDASGYGAPGDSFRALQQSYKDLANLPFDVQTELNKRQRKQMFDSMVPQEPAATTATAFGGAFQSGVQSRAGGGDVDRSGTGGVFMWKDDQGVDQIGRGNFMMSTPGPHGTTRRMLLDVDSQGHAQPGQMVPARASGGEVDGSGILAFKKKIETDPEWQAKASGNTPLAGALNAIKNNIFPTRSLGGPVARSANAIDAWNGMMKRGIGPGGSYSDASGRPLSQDEVAKMSMDRTKQEQDNAIALDKSAVGGVTYAGGSGPVPVDAQGRPNWSGGATQMVTPTPWPKFGGMANNLDPSGEGFLQDKANAAPVQPGQERPGVGEKIGMGGAIVPNGRVNMTPRRAGGGGVRRSGRIHGYGGNDLADFAAIHGRGMTSSDYYANQRRGGGDFIINRAATHEIDPVTGLPQNPTEQQIQAQIDMLAKKGEEPGVPGAGGLQQAALISQYYDAKRSRNPLRLREAADAIEGFKRMLNYERSRRMQEQEAAKEAQYSETPEGFRAVGDYGNDHSYIPPDVMFRDLQLEQPAGQRPTKSAGIGEDIDLDFQPRNKMEEEGALNAIGRDVAINGNGGRSRYMKRGGDVAEIHPYIVNEEGPEAFKPDGEKPVLMPGGEKMVTFKKDGKVIPHKKTMEMLKKGKVAVPHMAEGGKTEKSQWAKGKDASLELINDVKKAFKDDSEAQRFWKIVRDSGSFNSGPGAPKGAKSMSPGQYLRWKFPDIFNTDKYPRSIMGDQLADMIDKTALIVPEGQAAKPMEPAMEKPQPKLPADNSIGRSVNLGSDDESVGSLSSDLSFNNGDQLGRRIRSAPSQAVESPVNSDPFPSTSRQPLSQRSGSADALNLARERLSKNPGVTFIPNESSAPADTLSIATPHGLGSVTYSDKPAPGPHVKYNGEPWSPQGAPVQPVQRPSLASRQGSGSPGNKLGAIASGQEMPGQAGTPAASPSAASATLMTDEAQKTVDAILKQVAAIKAARENPNSYVPLEGGGHLSTMEEVFGGAPVRRSDDAISEAAGMTRNETPARVQPQPKSADIVVPVGEEDEDEDGKKSVQSNQKIMGPDARLFPVGSRDITTIKTGKKLKF